MGKNSSLPVKENCDDTGRSNMRCGPKANRVVTLPSERGGTKETPHWILWGGNPPESCPDTIPEVLRIQRITTAPFRAREIAPRHELPIVFIQIKLSGYVGFKKGTLCLICTNIYRIRLFLDIIRPCCWNFSVSPLSGEHQREKRAGQTLLRCKLVLPFHVVPKLSHMAGKSSWSCLPMILISWLWKLTSTTRSTMPTEQKCWDYVCCSSLSCMGSLGFVIVNPPLFTSRATTYRRWFYPNKGLSKVAHLGAFCIV